MLRAICILFALACLPLTSDAQWRRPYYYAYYHPYYYHVYYPQTVTSNSNNTTHNVTNNIATKSYQEILAELAQIRSKYDGNLRQAQVDHRQFMEAMGAFAGHYNSNYQQSYGQLGTAGNTQYGYTAQTILNAYGQNDIGALYLQASQLTRGAQQLAGQANTEFTGLVSQAGTNQARIAEILARAEAAGRVLRDLEMPRTTITNTSNSWENSTGGGPLMPPPNGPNGNGDGNPALRQVLQTKCASCHNATTRNGGFQASDYFGMSPEQKGYVISLLTTNDVNKRMPRIPDGTRLGRPGALFLEEIELFKR